MPKPPPAGSPFWKAWEVLTRANVGLFRLTNGRRVSPPIYVEGGENLAVVASKGGVDRHPSWFHNLRAHPETEVELPRRGRRRVHARIAEGTERERPWEKAVGVYKPYAEYQTYTERQIPVVVLEPAG